MTVKYLATMVAALATMSVTMAQEPNNPSVYRTIIDGATQPEKIPDRTKYAMFVKRYLIDIRDHLLQKLSPQDDAILYSLSVEEEAAEHADNELYIKDQLNLCAQRRSKNPVALARKYERMVDNFHDRRVNRYLKKLDALSPGGRKIVEDFVADVIVPNTKTEEFNYVVWVTSDPEEFLSYIELDCHFAETGEYPPDVQKAIDEKVREFEQERQAESEQLFKSFKETKK